MRRIRQFGFVLGSIIVLLLVMAGVGTSIIWNAIDARRAAAQDLGTPRIVYGLSFEPSGFDPHINSSAELGIVTRAVYDTLVYREPDTGNVTYGLASNVEIAPDGLIYTFTLKQGVKFHDGTSFDAYAVASNLDRIVDPQTRSQKAIVLLGPYDKYEVVDQYTIRLLLKTPYTPFLDALSQVYLAMASPTAFKQYDTARYQFHQVGTGPFRMIEYVPGDHITLQRNPDYTWRPSFYQPTTPESVQVVEFRFFSEAATRAPALETGAADIVGELPPADAVALARSPDLRIVPTNIPGQPLQFFLNTLSFPTDDLKVRQALLLGTDRQAITDSIFQQFSPVAHGPLSTRTLFYDSTVKDLYPYDKTRAAALLAEAGWSDSDNDGILDNNRVIEGKTTRVPLELVMIVPPWGLIPQVAQKIQSSWAEIGVQLTLRQVPNFGGLIAEVAKQDYHLVAYNDYGLDPAILGNFYRSDGAANYGNYASSDIDTALAAAAVSMDAAERFRLYSSVQQNIMENAVILPIRDYVNLNAASIRIRDLQFDAYGWFPLLPNIKVTAQ